MPSIMDYIYIYYQLRLFQIIPLRCTSPRNLRFDVVLGDQVQDPNSAETYGHVNDTQVCTAVTIAQRGIRTDTAHRFELENL